MGKLALLSAYSPRETLDVYPPINYRNPDDCRVMVFPEGSRERSLYDYEAVQYCKGERAPSGFHIVEDLQTGQRGMFWICDRPDGNLCVRDYKGSPSCRIYRKGEVRIVGRIFQYIPDLEDSERFEIVRGEVASHVDDGHLLFNIAGA